MAKRYRLDSYPDYQHQKFTFPTLFCPSRRGFLKSTEKWTKEKYNFRIKYKSDIPGEKSGTCMGWKHMVSGRSYSSMQSNFFPSDTFFELFSDVLPCFHTRAQVWFWPWKIGWITTCTSPHTILDTNSTDSLSHQYLKGTCTGVIKGASLGQGFSSVLVSLCQKQEIMESPEPTEEHEIYKPTHSVMAKNEKKCCNLWFKKRDK